MEYSDLAKSFLTITRIAAPKKVKPLTKLLYCCATTDDSGRMILDPTINLFCKVKLIERNQQTAENCCKSAYRSDPIANRKIVFSTEDENLEAKVNETLAALDQIFEECFKKMHNCEFLLQQEYVT